VTSANDNDVVAVGIAERGGGVLAVGSLHDGRAEVPSDRT
jgi:hypothetical protein